jgi:tetratricopeptide (TPR) repeat protein
MNTIRHLVISDAVNNSASNSHIAVFIFLLCLSTIASADDLEDQKKKNERCQTAMSSAETAASAEDWIRAEKFSKEAIRFCSEGEHTPYDMADRYSSLAEAQIELKRYQDALNTSEQCIDTYYATPNCHYYKVLALLGLKRRNEAKEAGRIATVVCNSVLEEKAETWKTVYYVDMLMFRKKEAQRILRYLAIMK